MKKNTAEELGAVLKALKIQCATVESCTGGLVSAAITECAGSSGWFDRAFITYSNQAKQELVNVEAETLAKYGAVSEQVAQQMAEGAILNSNASISIAISGIAGPGGGSSTKPVGMVCFAIAGGWQVTSCQTRYFDGDRACVRQQATEYALQQLVIRAKAMQAITFSQHNYFIALWLNEASKQKVYRWTQQNLSSKHLSALNDLHLTLAYLGKLPSTFIEQSVIILRNFQQTISSLTLEQLGQFEQSNAVWLAPVSKHQSLLNLQKQLIKQLITIGYIPERRAFLPHITIARQNQCQSMQIKAFEIEFSEVAMAFSRGVTKAQNRYQIVPL